MDLKPEPSEGRLLFRGVRRDSYGHEQPIALAYIERVATQADIATLQKLPAAQRVLVSSVPCDLQGKDVKVFSREEFSRYLHSLSTVSAGHRAALPRTGA